MFVWDSDAEEMLVNILLNNTKFKNLLYCVHIREPNLDPQKLRLLPRLLERWVRLDETHMLFCDNGDVFLVSDVMSMKVFNLLQEQFNEWMGLPSHVRAQLEFYDMNLQATALIGLAQSRLAAKQERARLAEAQKKAAILKADFRPDLVATIVPRRLAHKQPCILIIEDDPFTRRLVGTALGKVGQVSFADTGAKGIMDYITLAPSIVFLDIGLPDISGKDILKKILSVDPAAYVVMLSGNGNTANIMDTMRAGAKGFVGKPFTPEKLYSYVSKTFATANQKEA